MISLDRTQAHNAEIYGTWLLLEVDDAPSVPRFPAACVILSED